MRKSSVSLDAQQNQPVGQAFARTSKRMALFVAGFAVFAFAIGSETLLRIQANRSIAASAELYSTAIDLCDSGDLSRAAARLASRSDRLLAVATLDEQGALRDVFPNEPSRREIAANALGDIGNEFRVGGMIDGIRSEAVGVIVQSMGGEFAPPSRLLLIMRYVSYRGGWIQAVAVVTLAVGTITFLRVRTLNRWFDRRVARPLREIASLKLDPNAALSQMPALETGAWHETLQITQQIESLLRNFADADARARRVEQETRRQILHRELGFDLKLRRARDEATTDPLTRTRNRGYLESELEPVFNRQRELNAPLSAVMIDIDNFKRYNDAHGHQVGDSLLRFAGSLLRGGIRPTDHAIRYGGDEFLLLLPDTEAQTAAAIAERLIKLFGQYVGQQGKDTCVSMSAGVASIPDDTCESGAMLVARADAALYAAKASGKNSVAVDSSAIPDPSPSPKGKTPSTECLATPLGSTAPAS